MHFIQEFQIYRWFIKSGLNVKWRIYRILNPKLWKVKNKSPPLFFLGGGGHALRSKTCSIYHCILSSGCYNVKHSKWLKQGGGCPNYRVNPWWCPFLRAAFDSIRYQYWLLYTTPFCCFGRIKTFVLPMSSLVARQCHYEHCQFGNVADGVTKDGFLMMRLFCWLDLFNCELIVHYSI